MKRIWPDGTWHNEKDVIPKNWKYLMEMGNGIIIKEEDIMPAKRPLTDEEIKMKVRQEGRRGFLKVKKEKIDEIGASKLEDIFDNIGFQIFGRTVQPTLTEFYGYCPLFAPLTLHEKTLSYVMRVDFKEPDPIVEMFKVEED